MRTIRWYAAVLSVLAFSTAWSADVYDIDAQHSQVGFTVKHLGISTVPGKFEKFSGTITLGKPDPTAAKVAAVIEADSVNTGVEARDKHLKSPDFFDAAKFTTLKFVSVKNSPLKDGQFVMEGKLTMHGVTKPVKMDVQFGGSAKDPWGSERAAFTATGTVNRKDFGMVWNKVLDNGGVMVSDEVKITLQIEAVKRTPKKK
jgi:polyisoprenoid-binding protein YceI